MAQIRDGGNYETSDSRPIQNLPLALPSFCCGGSSNNHICWSQSSELGLIGLIISIRQESNSSSFQIRKCSTTVTVCKALDFSSKRFDVAYDNNPSKHNSYQPTLTIAAANVIEHFVIINQSALKSCTLTIISKELTGYIRYTHIILS